ncbi:hypothetical protein ACVNIS_05550 [Sphaerotilaceae bacterium SBD11-9]
MSQQRNHHRRIAPAMWVSALALSAIAPALAQEVNQDRSPYYFGVSQAFSYDSNVYRTPSNEISETISVTGLTAGLDQAIGRQRLHADAVAEINRYRNIDALNNKSYALTAALDWETIEFLSGVLRYSTRNSLADFGTLNGSTAASDQTTEQFLATARLGLTSRTSFDASYEHRDLKYKNEAYSDRNYNQDAVSGGLRWGTTGLLVFGIAYRATKGRTPQFQSTPPYEDELDRRDIDFTTMWTPSGLSTLNARISSTKETHTLPLPSGSDRSAITGAIAWDYRATGKLNLTTSITRDTGAETTFLGLTPGGTTPLQVDQSTLSTSFQFQARYAMTSKISMNGDARYRKGKLNNGEEEKITGAGLSINYEPMRSITLGCSALYEDRDTTSLYAYKATTASCSAQFTLR